MSDYSRPGRIINWFTARFDSECEFCFASILEGDEAAYVDDEIACERCIDSPTG